MPYDPQYQKDWYAKNKIALSARRKEKYKSDPQLRAKAGERAARQREKNKAIRPEGYEIMFEQAAAMVGVQPWSLRWWRRKNYFPEPVSFGGRLWFTKHQVGLLGEIKKFMEENNIRVGQSRRGKLEDMCNFVSANW